MLVLYDIDATLIRTSRLGITAMGLAGRDRYGDAFDEHRVEYAGRLDPLIIADLLAAHAIEATPEAVASFRAGYGEHLERLLRADGVAGPCPGVPALLDAVDGLDGVATGLLTGNYPETGTIKLRACGIDPGRFAIHVWGCDSPHEPPARDHLPAVALDRYAAHAGRRLAGADVAIIGDTPHDIACARAHGCRVLAVATGRYGLDELAHADRAVADLSATEEIVAWLMQR